MRLLFDNNLSPRLVQRLSDQFPDAEHVAPVGLGTATDEEVWAYASNGGFTIVTKDVDFNELVVLRGFPPKVVWLRLGNCSTGEIEEVLRKHSGAIGALERDTATGLLIIGR